MQDALKTPAFRRRAITFAVAVAVAIAALWFASRIPRTLSVFVIAAFIAFGVEPIVTRLQRRRMPRGGAIAIVYVSLFAIFGILGLLVIPATLSQIESIGASAPEYIAAVQSWIDSAQRFLAEHFGRSYLPPGYGDLRGLIAARVSTGLTGSISSVTDVIVGTLTAAFVVVSALVLSAFFLVRGEYVAESFYELLPRARRDPARRLGAELAEVFGSFVSGQALLCAITGALVFAFCALAGLRFALLLGIVAGIAYAVPFVGMVLAHVVALVLAAPQGLSVVLWTQAIVFTIARISDNLLVPKIMSESVGVSPIVVMFSVFAGGELFGLPGLVLGIPAAALIKVAWRFYRAGSLAAEPHVFDPAPSNDADATVTVEVAVRQRA